MHILTNDEFEKMEALLARLLVDATPDEEVKIVNLHQRLIEIYENQSKLRQSKDRLVKLQTAQ